MQDYNITIIQADLDNLFNFIRGSRITRTFRLKSHLLRQLSFLTLLYKVNKVFILLYYM